MKPMKLKMKHLRHPLQSAADARHLAARYIEIKQFGNRSARHFRGDPRYDLENASQGMIPRPGDSSDDTQLLERICDAYNKSIQQEEFTPETYRASEWWQRMRQQHLSPVIDALQTRNIAALGSMYRNFFRDPCAAGLIGVPGGMYKACFGGRVRDIYRRLFLGEALYSIDHWTLQTGGRFPLSALAGPEIGNPFGIALDGTLIRTGTAHQHYSAQKICDRLDSKPGVVAEIGGGFGGMAYYLLRDRPRIKYLDFDVAESIALASYYLLKAFPQLRFLLYGEKQLTPENLAWADAVLMPLFEIERMPRKSVDLVFSSHAMSDISCQAMADYLKIISRITKRHLMYVGNGPGARSINQSATVENAPFQCIGARPSGWHIHQHPDIDEVECVYRIRTDFVDVARSG